MPSPTSQYEHFQGKEPLEHIKEARRRGTKATSEPHGVETPGAVLAGADSAKETAIVFIGFFVLLYAFGLPIQKILLFLAIFSLGWLLWKVGRSAMLGWARLERLHRLIEQEQWEIQHKRGQEREELFAMYHRKGLKGKLLEEVVDVLMADDDRLLWVMLEEELGLTLESYEHPLKQALGAGIGVVTTALLGAIGMYVGGVIAFFTAMALIIMGGAFISAKWEGNDWIKSIIWNLAIAILSIGSMYFLANLILYSK
jgi:hypothetical protein